MNKTTKHISQMYRSLQFHTRKKVKIDIEKLLKHIIEKFSGQTSWISSIVTPLNKGNPDEVRICINM